MIAYILTAERFTHMADEKTQAEEHVSAKESPEKCESPPTGKNFDLFLFSCIGLSLLFLSASVLAKGHSLDYGKAFVVLIMALGAFSISFSAFRERARKDHKKELTTNPKHRDLLLKFIDTFAAVYIAGLAKLLSISIFIPLIDDHSGSSSNASICAWVLGITMFVGWILGWRISAGLTDAIHASNMPTRARQAMLWALPIVYTFGFSMLYVICEELLRQV
jgi:hypothetical protein